MTEEPRVVSQSQLHTQLEDVLRKVLLCARLREHPFLRLWKERKPDVPLDKIHLYCSEALRPMAVITDIATAAKDAWLEVYRTGMKFEDESKVVDLCCHMSLVAFARTIEQKRAGWPGISGIPSINVVAIEAAAIMAAVWLDTGLTLRIDASGKGKRIVVSNLIYDLAEIQFGVKGIEAAIEDEIHAFARNDHQIAAGDEWKSAIDMQLDTCRIAVLLLSKDFIGSKFISNVEVPRLLERHAGRGMRIVPVLYDDFAFKHVPWLARLQLRPRDGKALAKFRPADRDTQMRLIAEEIATLCKA